MPIDDLEGLVSVLENAGQLRRVKTKVSAELEIAEILRRVTYDVGPAILFENVTGSSMPVLGNVFGSMDRMRLALEMSNFEEIGARIADLAKMTFPSGMFEKLRKLPELSKMGDAFPKETKTGPVTEIVGSGKFSDLPILKTWPNDAGRFITFGLVATKHPDTGIYNLGVYRMQIVDDTHALMHWQKHKRGAAHHDENTIKGKKTEAAIIIGADPATIFSAVAPVPEGLDKYLFSGIVRKCGIKTVKCKTIGLQVPANAEIVLEGHVDSNNMQDEGPFGDHTGYYTPVGKYPTFTLTGVMQRKHPIYLTTVVGKPVLEDAYIGKVIERSFLPLLQLMQPELVDFAMPPSGWFHGIAIASIKKRYPGQAKKVMMGLWGMGQLALTKTIIIVDDDINVHNINDVIWAVTTRSDAARDITIIKNTPTDTLDPASPLPNLGSKMGIDATQKTLQEGYTRPEQILVKTDDSTKRLVDSKWSDYGLDTTGA